MYAAPAFIQPEVSVSDGRDGRQDWARRLGGGRRRSRRAFACCRLGRTRRARTDQRQGRHPDPEEGDRQGAPAAIVIPEARLPQECTQRPGREDHDPPTGFRAWGLASPSPMPVASKPPRGRGASGRQSCADSAPMDGPEQSDAPRERVEARLTRSTGRIGPASAQHAPITIACVWPIRSPIRRCGRRFQRSTEEKGDIALY